MISAASRNEIRNVSINWVSYYFVFEEKFVKRSVQCHAFMDSSSDTTIVPNVLMHVSQTSKISVLCGYGSV